MTAIAKINAAPAAALPHLEAAEQAQGRAHWTYADYVAEGRRDYAASGRTNKLHETRWAQAYANMHCPLSKRGKQRFGGAL